MEKFNITFNCEHGNFKLQDCTKVPTKEQIDESIENFGRRTRRN